MVAVKKNILFLGRPEGSMEQIRQNLVESIDNKINPCFVFAKDGPEAALKAQNQKFDAVVVDANSPRLREGGFLDGIRRHKNTASSGLILIVPDESAELAKLKEADHILQKPCTVDALVRALAKALIQVEADIGTAASAPASSGFAVDVRVLNALVKSTCFICQQFGIDQIQLKKPEIKPMDQLWKGDIGASIAIQSQLFQGALVVSFEAPVYLKMYAHMLGEEQAGLNDENKEAIGEISNMILGNAKSDFTQYNVAMTIPKMLQKGQMPEHPPGSAALLIQAQVKEGFFYIEVIAHRLTEK
jgi:chemotaxis protein CheX